MTVSKDTTKQPLLVAREVAKYFKSRAGAFDSNTEPVVAVDGVNLIVHRGESVGVLGESGCGKTTLGRMLAALIEPSEGMVQFEGHDLAALPAKYLRQARRKLQFVFQDPMGSLNPRMKVGKAVLEPLVVHKIKPKKRKWRDIAAEHFARVGLDGSLVDSLPHELSGGQRQRVCIARALATEPDLLVADEPVASLDVSVQAQVLSMMQELFLANNRALVLISHDVRVVTALCDRVVVMYFGRIVETGTSNDILTRPLHPYTRLLIDSVCALHPNDRHVVAQEVPAIDIPPKGCPFWPRCDRANDYCIEQAPEEGTFDTGRMIRCYLPLEEHE